MDIKKGPQSPNVSARLQQSRHEGPSNASETTVVPFESLELRKARLQRVQDELEILQFRLGVPKPELPSAQGSVIAECLEGDICVRLVVSCTRALFNWLKSIFRPVE